MVISVLLSLFFVLFLLQIMLLGELKQENRMVLPIILRTPTWIFIVIILGGIGFQQASLISPSSNLTGHQDHGMHDLGD